MDRIEQLMKNAKPQVPGPGTAPGVLPGRSEVFSSDPNVVSLVQRKPRRTAWAATAGVTLAAAAVVGAIVVAGNLAPQSAPAPATTSTATSAPSPTPTFTGSQSATASPTAPATPVPPPTATTQPAAPATTVPATTAPPAVPVQPTIPAGPAAGSCTPANIDVQRNGQVRSIPASEQPYYTVLGCAEGWLAYAVSDDGLRAMGLDGGNAWYRIARLQANGRFLDPSGVVWSSVYTWEFHAAALKNNPDNKFATVQEAMDDEFASKGIPVRLRPQLVGNGPAL
ncbi:hypothetical protein [Paenarthrobacter sp. YJN-5]|uniref:hypothetical protein n=1 Tax=Paenarthrobacter sp. YJN-5 TaxID=2735316 RepID=UPI0018785DFF|nr:hypothetical protein [Paenarthrobacter sp. YJN-5]QOT18663.1 hypothetical protein HMI59_20045 [Paenarthrobacter sp. YJN-5]